MAKLLGIGVLFQVAVCAAVGGRLLWLAARTRKIPELALGLAYVLLGVLGYPLAIVVRSGALSEAASGPLLAAALAAQNLSIVGIYVMTWRTFHPSSRLLGVAIGIVVLGFGVSLVGGGVGSLSGGALARSLDEGGFYYLGLALRSLGFFWAAGESVRYHALLRRRLVLGLADAVVVDRFRLWSIATVATSFGFVFFLFGKLTIPGYATSPWVLSVTSAVGIISGVSLWLAFVPPARYTRRVVLRARPPA